MNLKNKTVLAGKTFYLKKAEILLRKKIEEIFSMKHKSEEYWIVQRREKNYFASANFPLENSVFQIIKKRLYQLSKSIIRHQKIFHATNVCVIKKYFMPRMSKGIILARKRHVRQHWSRFKGRLKGLKTLSALPSFLCRFFSLASFLEYSFCPVSLFSHYWMGLPASIPDPAKIAI